LHSKKRIFIEQRLACACSGFEHVEALGGTIEAIAAAKAGIMKAGRPIVVGQQAHARAMETLQQCAGALGCEMVYAQDQVSDHARGV